MILTGFWTDKLLFQEAVLILETPKGSIQREDNLFFKWRYSGNVSHYVIRIYQGTNNIVDQAINAVWVSNIIPGNNDFLRVLNPLKDIKKRRFFWVLEVYWQNNLKAKGSQSFKFKAEFALLKWLAQVSEIREPPYVLYCPHGKIIYEDSLIFRWSTKQRPNYFIIKLFEEGVKIIPQEIWNSGKITGDARSFAAIINVKNYLNSTYYWQLEAYKKDSRTPNPVGKQFFSFLSDGDLKEMHKYEANILEWIQQRPKDDHLILLLGLYYAYHHMYINSREMFTKFMKLESDTIYSYKGLTTKLAKKIKEITAKRDSLKIQFYTTKDNSNKIKILSEIHKINLSILDYDSALWCINELFNLLDEKQDKIINFWRGKKDNINNEYMFIKKFMFKNDFINSH